MTAASPPFRSPDLLNRDDSRLLIVDMQERLLAVMPEAESLVASCEVLVRGAHCLGVPVSATEQYPRGLGPTVAPLASLLKERPEKLRFSSTASFEWSRAAGETDRVKVVVAGIETHVCIQQTVLDLLAAGFNVFVAADAVASREHSDRDHALHRMRDVGATVTTTEAILFEWCETAESPEFKEISRLVKERTSRPV